MQKQKQKQGFKCHAYLGLSNDGGIEIELSNCGDAVKVRYYGVVDPNWIEIDYNSEGEPFFLFGDFAFNLNDFMRANI